MRLAIVSAALLAAVVPVAARAATCTVTAAKVLVKDSGFERPMPEMVGYAIPVVIDETTGSFQADFTDLPVGTFSISGVSNSLEVKANGPVTGTIDSAGNVSLPPMQVDFTTALLPLDVPMTAHGSRFSGKAQTEAGGRVSLSLVAKKDGTYRFVLVGKKVPIDLRRNSDLTVAFVIGDAQFVRNRTLVQTSRTGAKKLTYGLPRKRKG